MRMIPPARRLALFAAATLPFILLPVGLTQSVGPLARVGARWFNLLLPDLSSPVDSRHNAAPSHAIAPAVSADPSTDEQAPPFNERHAPSPSGLRARSDRRENASLSGSIAAQRAAPGRRARANVFVGPDSIQRAIPVAGRPTSSWTSRTLDHPAGLLIQSPGALTGVIEAGDILVEAEGQPLGSFEQLLATVRQAYERRVKRLSGRLFRKGDLVPLTVEPGW
jgi:hypothetical protein